MRSAEFIHFFSERLTHHAFINLLKVDGAVNNNWCASWVIIGAINVISHFVIKKVNKIICIHAGSSCSHRLDVYERAALLQSDAWRSLLYRTHNNKWRRVWAVLTGSMLVICKRIIYWNVCKRQTLIFVTVNSIFILFTFLNWARTIKVWKNLSSFALNLLNKKHK